MRNSSIGELARALSSMHTLIVWYAWLSRYFFLARVEHDELLRFPFFLYCISMYFHSWYTQESSTEIEATPNESESWHVHWKIMSVSLQWRHWRDDFDLIITDRDVSMHSIIISQKRAVSLLQTQLTMRVISARSFGSLTRSCRCLRTAKFKILRTLLHRSSPEWFLPYVDHSEHILSAQSPFVVSWNVFDSGYCVQLSQPKAFHPVFTSEIFCPLKIKLLLGPAIDF